MIDNQLLAKICADDDTFRKQIISKVLDQTRDFAKSLNESVRKKNWSRCYYQMLDFYHAITPYAKMSFLREFKKSLDNLSHTDDGQIKRGICMEFLQKLSAQMKIAAKPLQSKKVQNTL